MTLFLIPVSQAGLWRAALSHPSSPMCVKSCESRLQEQMRPRAFLAFSVLIPLPVPSPAPRLVFSGGFDNMFI